MPSNWPYLLLFAGVMGALALLQWVHDYNDAKASDDWKRNGHF
jgi:hypothetical protein